MHFDFDDWAKAATLGIRPPRASEQIAEDSAWLVIEINGWVPIPQLLFALKEQIMEQIAGG